MVRFSDIVITDGKARRHGRSSAADIPKAPTSTIKGTAYETAQGNAFTKLPPALPGKEAVRNYYRLLFERVNEIRKRVLEKQEVYPYLTVSVFRHILEKNLIDDIQSYAASVPDAFAPVSHIIANALFRLRQAKQTGQDIQSILKFGFDALLQDMDDDAFADTIFRPDGYLTPTEVAAIKKKRPAQGTLSHILKEPGTHGEKHYGSPGKALTREETDKMENSDNAHKGLEELPQTKKSVPIKLLVWIIILILIVMGGYYLFGRFSGDNFRRAQSLNAENRTAIPTKKETPPPDIDTEKSVSGPVKKTIPVRKKQDATDKTDQFFRSEAEPLPKTVEPETGHEPATRLGPIAEKYPYTVHAGSFKSLDRTETAMDTLEKDGFSPYWVKVDLRLKGEWYRVFVGQFKTSHQAEQFLAAHDLKISRVLKTTYAVRVGVFASEETLDKKMALVKKNGFCPYIKQAEDRYELLVGAYQNKNSAQSAAAALKAAGVDGEVIAR